MEVKKTVLIMIVCVLAAGSAFTAEKHDCSYCHITDSKTAQFLLKSPLSVLCLECHADRSGVSEHKVDVTPKTKVEKLPLSKEGKITCITCHDQHEKSGYPKLLRERHDELCLSCHLK